MSLPFGAMKSKQNYPGIPDYEGIARPAPAPPKYLVQADGTQIKIDGGLGGPKKITYSDESSRPVAARISTSPLPKKLYDMPAHHYRAGDKTSGGGAIRSSVDSRYQCKGEGGGSGNGMRTAAAPPIQYIGSTYQHLPNTPSLSMAAPPKGSVTVPRAFIPVPKQAFAAAVQQHAYRPNHGDDDEAFRVQKPTLLGNRTSNGDILGSPTNRYVSSAHVPYQDPNTPVRVRAPKALPAAAQAVQLQPTSFESLISTCCAENPVVTLTNEWCVCFDESADALYYYSNVTGEATWIQPNLHNS